MAEARWILGIDAPITDAFIDPPAHIARELAQQNAHGDAHFNSLAPSVCAQYYRDYDAGCQPGGTIGNMLAQVAALGGRAAIFGVIGDDTHGLAMAQNLSDRGIHQVLPVQKGRRSPVIYAMRHGLHDTLYRRDDGDGLSMKGEDMVLLAADNKTGPIIAMQMRRYQQVDPSVRDHIQHDRDAYGAQLALGMQAIKKKTRAQNPELFELFCSADIVFGNADEYRTMLQAESDPLPALLATSGSKAAGIFVMTNGGEPTIAVQQGKVIASVTPHPLPDDHVCSIGAGDATMAGVLYGLSQPEPWPLEDCLKLGALCSHNIFRVHGGQPEPKTPGSLAHLAAQARALKAA